MATHNKSIVRWTLIACYLGLLTIILACVEIGVGSNLGTSTPNSREALLRVEDGTLQLQDGNGNWIPVAGDSAFDVTGELESTAPWQVKGITLETNEATQIEEGLQAGDLVRVRGVILEEGKWLATSIERAEEQIDPIIILIGRVDSVDPWSVNGIQLNVTEDTDIQGTITPGMLVRVEILLSPDGTWEVLSIAPLADPVEDAGCMTIIAIVVRVEGNEIQLSGWPVITLDEDVKIETGTGGEGILGPNQIVLVVLCPSEDGGIVVIQITILANSGDGETSTEGGEKVLVCHKPDKKGGHTLSISSSAVPAHLGHGDKLGPCP